MFAKVLDLCRLSGNQAPQDADFLLCLRLWLQEDHPEPLWRDPRPERGRPTEVTIRGQAEEARNTAENEGVRG